jgi:hypothetical protein
MDNGADVHKYMAVTIASHGSPSGLVLIALDPATLALIEKMGY